MRSGGDPKFCGKKQFPQILPQLLSSAIFGFFEGLGGVAVSCPPQKSWWLDRPLRLGAGGSSGARSSRTLLRSVSVP